MAVLHSPYFDLFPTIEYDIDRTRGSSPQTVPNIFFRLRFLREVLNQTSSYLMYRLEEGDTPEILAEKIYNDSGAGWMILYANKIMDPQFDWPLTDSEFDAYIIAKYGSIEKAQTAIHSAQKIVTVENLSDSTTHTQTYDLCVKRLTDNRPDVPFDYWVWQEQLTLGPDNGVLQVTGDSIKYFADSQLTDLTADLDLVIFDNSLARQSYSRQYSIDLDVFVETTTAKLISVYDHEMELNENKKFIRVIKSMYYDRIMNEFRHVTGHEGYQFTSRLMG